MTTETNKRPFFSLVMPTHGVEQFIADAVADVLVQTFGDFELVVVDDASPDRSIEVAQAVAGDDPRVRIVRHEQNRGVSAARNTGLDATSGTWILFPDPDDRYAPDLLEKVALAIDRHEGEIDLVMFAHTQQYFAEDGRFLYENPILLEAGTWPHGEALGRRALELEKQTHLGYPWNKAYRLEAVRAAQARFEDDVPFIEDILFNLAFLRQSQAITCIPDVLYRYAKRLGTNLTNERTRDYYPMHRRRIEEVRDFIDDCGALDGDARATLGALYARYILSTLEQNTAPESSMSHDERIAWLEQLFDDPLFQELIPEACADDSRSLALCLKLLQARNVPALLAVGRTIHAVRVRDTALYSKAKSRR